MTKLKITFPLPTCEWTHHKLYMYMYTSGRSMEHFSGKGFDSKGKCIVFAFVQVTKCSFIIIVYVCCTSILIAHMMQVSLTTGVRLSFVPRHSQFSWSSSIWEKGYL